MNVREPGDVGQEVALESWKEIAAYLGRQVKTVQRWEKEEGLPVHRHTHRSRSSVYAYASEIDRWRAARKVVIEPPPSAPLWRRLLTPSFAVTLAMCLVMVGNGIRPMVAGQGQTRTLICSGAGCDGAISPDGKSMAIQLAQGGIGVRNLATGKIRTLVEPDGSMLAAEVFSPDGSKIAYSRIPKEPAKDTKQTLEAIETVVVNLNGTGSRTVSRGGGFVLAWSADGRRLLRAQLSDLTAHAANLAWLNVADGAIQKLPTAHANLAEAVVSPDGKYVAFNGSRDGNAEGNAYIMASDGSGETLVSPSAARQEPIGWTPDGKYLVFAQYGATVSLWAVPTSNGKVQGPAINAHLDLQQGTRYLGMDRAGEVYYRIATYTSDIFTATMDPVTGKVTSAPVPVPVSRTGANAIPKWAPDSQRIAYIWAKDGGPQNGGPPIELSVYSLGAGSTERIATQAKIALGFYCWSQDAGSILYSSTEASEGVERISLATGQTTPLLPKAFSLRNCGTDSVIGREAGNFAVRDLKGGAPKMVYNFAQTPANTPTLSHDGRSVAFLTPAQGANALHVVSSDGGPVRDLVTLTPPAQLQIAIGLTWSADDRFVYFAQRADSKSPYELFRVPAAGGTPETVGLKAQDLRDLNIAPDGKHIAFSLGSGLDVPEVWAIRNFLPSK